MTNFTPTALRTKLGSGLLSFPVSNFNADYSLDLDGYRENIARLSRYTVAGLFAAGGTGEFFSLTAAEVADLVRAAVESAPADTPIIAPAGIGGHQAAAMARSAEELGADGILLFPPYLTEASDEGLYGYARDVCRATKLGVIVYNRANARYSADTLARLAEEFPNFIGFKDGVGELEAITRVRSRLQDRLLYISGLPTAEIFALPYLELGATTYSSAMFNFLPAFAVSFYTAVRAGEKELIQTMLREVVLPYADIRDRRAGYAVSIVKAGLRLTENSAGPVRAPLTDLTETEHEDLAKVVAAARKFETVGAVG